MSLRAVAPLRWRVRAWSMAAMFVATAAQAQAVVEDLDTPFVITPTNVVTAMLDLAMVKSGDRLIDLGSGDGRIVIAAAQRGAVGVGIEIDTQLVERSRASARRMKLEDRATFVTQDLFETDFSAADVVTLYLLPDVNKRLAPKFLATLRPGTRIVSHDYGLGDWPPDRTIVVDAPDKPVNVEKKSTLHFWRVPAQVAGRWSAGKDDSRVELEVRQAYQRVSGTLRWNGSDYAFVDQRVDGADVVMRAERPGRAPLDIVLRANDDVLVGTMQAAKGKPVPLALRRS